ncbi:MAG: [protein-PII] uridylyltransferase [Thermodesulfobacteriota bacterium]|nr:[protein-PII] uridylyltransferase [Thermodesulfobacteriota bacterium]
MILIDDSKLLPLLNAASSTNDFTGHRDDFLAQASQFLEHHQTLIRDRHRQGACGAEIVANLTALTDKLISTLFTFVCSDISTMLPCTLIALGGYGRCEMNPHSDIDLMFYVNDLNSPFTVQVSERLLYLLWDLDLDVGHSVRDDDACFTIAGNDLSACTSLLDSRYICGDESLYQHYASCVLPKIIIRNSHNFIRKKMVEHRRRLKKYGSSVYLLEPNIKEGEGGLRDLHTILWIAKVKYKVDSLRGLIIKGLITEPEADEFMSSLDYLWRIRNELHYLSPRKNEQLHFEQQEQIANFLGYKNSKKALAVEQFMQDYYAATTRVEHLTSTLIARASHQEKKEQYVGDYSRRRNIDDGFYALRGELHLNREELFIDSPETMMKAFQLVQRHHLDMSLQVKALIRQNLHRINDRFRRSRQVNTIFLDILRHKKGVSDVLFQMHHLLFLNHYIPEFKRIFCQVQHDAYHIYTVDTHTLFAVKEIDQLWQGKYAAKKPLLTRLADEIEKPELMILAVMMHDIGKGQGQNHCEKGAKIIPTIARRFGLGKEDRQRLEFLVRQHLLMAHISQRRDLNDPHLILQFAQTMVSSENLKMLYLLTFSDIKAVGPDVWSEWKGFLLKELYEKSYAVMEKGNFQADQYLGKIRNRKREVAIILSDDFNKKTINECLRNFSTRYLTSYRSCEIANHIQVILGRGSNTLAMQVVHNQEQSFTEVIISTLNIPGLFSNIAGIMAANGVNILGAQIFTQKNGVAVDILQVGREGNIYNDERKWKKIKQDLISFLEGCKCVEDLVRKREDSSLDLSRNAPTAVPCVEIDNEISHEYTVFDIFAKDEVGLLYQMTNSLKNMGINISVSKITTMGDHAGNTFYIQDIFGHKIIQSEKLAELQQTLLDELSE